MLLFMIYSGSFYSINLNNSKLNLGLIFTKRFVKNAFLMNQTIQN